MRMRSRLRVRIVSSCWTTPRRRRIERTSAGTTSQSSSIDRFDRRAVRCDLKASSTAGDKGSSVFDGSPDLPRSGLARRTARPRRDLPRPWMAEDEGSPEDDRLREGDGMARWRHLRGPLLPPRIFRGHRAHPRTAHPIRGLPVLPRDDRDHDLFEDEVEQEVHPGIRARCRLRRLRPRPRAPWTRWLVPRSDPRARLEAIDLLRELEVEVREAALVVRGQSEPNRRPRVVDIGVVVHGLGEFADLVDETQSRREVLEFPGPGDRVPFPRPPGDFLQSIRNLRFSDEGPSRHHDLARNAALWEKGLETSSQPCLRLTCAARHRPFLGLIARSRSASAPRCRIPMRY